MDMTQDPDYKEYQEYLEYLKHSKAQSNPQQNPHQVANNQSSLMDMVKQGIGAYASHMGGVIKAGTLGNIDPGKLIPGFEDVEKAHPTANMVGKGVGAVSAAALTPSMPAIGGGALGRLLTGAGTGAVMGGLAKPEGEDSFENRAKGALSGAAMGAGTQLGLEALQAAPGALKAAYRSVVPEGAEKYYDKLEELIKGKTGTFQGKELPAEQILQAKLNGNAKDAIQANSALKNISPEIRDTIESKGSEMFGKSVRDKAWYGAIPGIMHGNVPMAAGGLATGVGVGALAGGGKEMLRQMGKNSTGLANDPTTLKAILDMIETQKSEK